MNSIPFFGNDRESLEFETDYLHLSQEVFKTGQFLNGPWVEEFEKNIAHYCQRGFAVALGSCTDALIFGLQALELPHNSKVLVPDFSFIASASPVLHAGHIPTFVDINPETAMADVDCFKKHLCSTTKAIIGVSLYGALAPLSDLEDFCKNNEVILVEDAAQSLGAQLSNKSAGSFGTFSVVSFDPTKTLHAFGAGGCLLTDDESIYQKVREMRLHGRDKDLKFSSLGRKSLLPSLDAHVLNFKLNKLDNWIEKRQRIAKIYEEAINSNHHLSKIETIANSTHAYHKFVLKCRNAEERQQLAVHFKEHNITTRVHYDRPLSHHELFHSFKTENKAALELSQTVLSLPIFHELKEEEILSISKIIRDFSPQTL